ncbi:NAD-dependent epimerase/dehydratase family protein [Polaribacter sp. IC073]|uniref:NAD-dependent epimerase/dehydratase family protein n=1 Tax=Polaribacter sp. IC073 TaxID=2508540 RepID=UPI0011BEEABC|nr:NAD(P)-dependent oxidoreductase [Polaribacter sp. IC073]TXD47208.1 NAD(P)-dependent oxidoreductase [Polaribacter sp. IC073]
MLKTKILITGASGTVGFEVLKQLSKKESYHLTIFDKKTKLSLEKLKPFESKIDLIYGDISKNIDLEQIKGIDVVIHLAAIIPPLADELQELAYNVNVLGTQNLIRQLELHSPNAFLMYSSSISVYGDRIKKPYIKVTDKLQPSDGDAYGETKITAEKCVSESNLDWSIFRLAAIMGNHKMSKLMFHQPLNTALEIATPKDTARAFVNGIEKQKQLSKQVFNLGGGESCRISYQHFLERSFAIFGLGKLNFPKHSFADKNFHCGYYADGDNLENIVHFRQDNLEDYFKMEAKKVTFIKKFAASVLKKPIKWFLLKKSEPYEAYKNKNVKQMKHYFN